MKPSPPPPTVDQLVESAARPRWGPLGLMRARFFVTAIPLPWLRVVVAILLAGAVNEAFRASRPFLGGATSLVVLALVAVLASAWLGRFLSGMITLLLCVGLWAYYFSTPPKTFVLPTIEDWWLLLLFLSAGTFVSLIIEGLHASRQRVEKLVRDRASLNDMLLTERERLAALISNLPGIVWELEVDDWEAVPRPSYFSANVGRLLGYSADELIAPAGLWDKVLLREERDTFVDALRDVARGGAPRVVRHRWRPAGKDAPERWFETHCGGGGNEPTRRVRCVSLDVTQAQNIERALAATEQRFRDVADRSPILIWLAHPGEGLVWVNRAWREFRGRARAQEQGLGWIEGVHADEAPGIAREFSSALDRQQEFRLEFRIRREDGAWRWLLALGVPRWSEDGELQDYLGFCIDISDRKQLELEREALLDGTERARQAAEFAMRSRDEFLAKISHELRNPLNGILGWTQVLRRGDSSEEEVDRGIQLIDAGARALVQLVDDLLDVSRVAAGKMRVSLAPTDFARVVQAACQTVAPSAEAKGLTLDCDIPLGLPLVQGDSRRLQQVAWNLLANAVKFTPRGGRVTVRLEERGTFLVLTVSDTGIGIAPEFLSEVFAPFAQQESASTRRHRGLGLGLTIVRTLVEQHGGQVSATSLGRDHGATFEVSLPCALGVDGEAELDAPTAAQRTHAMDEARPLADMRVLLVDDDPTAREVVPMLLTRAGAQVHVADSAEAGLSALLSFRPDVLMSDIEMPGTDGYAFLRRVRALSDEEGGAVPAIAVTAYVRDEDLRRALLAGFQAHLRKPIEIEELTATLTRLAGRHG